MAQPIKNHYMLTNGGSLRRATSYVVEVSGLRYWVLKFNQSEGTLAGPNMRQYVLVNGSYGALGMIGLVGKQT